MAVRGRGTLRRGDVRGLRRPRPRHHERARLLWKIWTENATDRTAGGIYLFTDEASARTYCDMHTKRLQSFGVSGIRALFFDVNTALTATTRGPAS